MNIVVFGVAGFLGKQILKFLINDKSISKITVIIHKTGLPPELRTTKVREAEITEFLSWENNNKETYDVVVSLVGKYTAPKDGLDELKKSNFEIPKKIIDFCKVSSVKHVVFASSINVRLAESKGYARCKRQIESYLVHSGVPYTIFRPTLIFGPGDTGLSHIYNFISKFPFVPIFGDGKKLEQPIHVEEAADFFYKASLRQPENKIYEIGGLRAYTYNDLMKTMAAALGKKCICLHIPARPVFSILYFFELLGLKLPVNSEQILHIDTDLDVDNTAALTNYNVNLKPIEERIKDYEL